MTNTHFSRRTFLRSAAGLSAAGLLTACSGAITRRSTSSLRLALLTDIHLTPAEPALSGMKRALAHAQAQQPPAQAILNGGDSIMESLETDASHTEAQWVAFTQILSQECDLPVYSVIGNHDVWGWANPDATIQQDPRYGKGWAVKALGLPHRYYAFEIGEWQFFALDSTHRPILLPDDPYGDLAYTGRLDDEQFEWLAQQLVQSDPERPVCIFSHIPVLSAGEMIDGENEATGNWLVPGAWVHIDARRLVELFHQHPNVRLCLSGHSHQHERLEYLGVTYVSGGAVCGRWWMGDYMHFAPGYVLLDLSPDGSCDSQFVDYNA
jgi:3',5'-cyclic AMP phosphodiesterase CpdA